MKTVPTSTSARRKAAAATKLDCVTAFQAIALDCVAAIEGHHSSACAGDVEAVHQIRIAITRLRAAVMLFAPIVVDEEWPRLKEEIAWLNGALGAARDSDVALEYARRKEYRAWARCMIGERLEQQQVRNHRRLVRCLRSPRTQRLLAALARWIRQGPWLERCRRSSQMSLHTYSARELDRWHKRLIRKGRHLKKLAAAPRHRLRIKAKRFRYMLEALKESGALRGQREWQQLHRPAKRLQRTLGDLRDLERFADLADRSLAESGKHAAKHPPGFRQRTEKLLDAASAAHRDLRHAGID
ncbi:CHAD domain-containing protein [Bradyrhizobium sp.]|uniref:CHAD domain-containing protein n=1 Tax=Bradyrhizobium sp. TaxID=376 RepID=UPI002C29FE64|nr:CHAD domain-containing protein [Bradyrhizobium sp.]HMM88773.1 CHAD domain-containing protein [Bradyrhizobium sp.]